MEPQNACANKCQTTVKFQKTTGSPINMKAKLHGCLKCGKPGKVREWNMSQENLEKSGNVTEGTKKIVYLCYWKQWFSD